jgi:hypothetical protein
MLPCHLSKRYSIRRDIPGPVMDIWADFCFMKLKVVKKVGITCIEDFSVDSLHLDSGLVNLAGLRTVYDSILISDKSSRQTARIFSILYHVTTYRCRSTT